MRAFGYICTSLRPAAGRLISGVRLTHRIFHMKNYILASAILFAGCSSLPRYVSAPASESPAIVSNYSNLLLCKLNGIKGPDGYNACQARLLVIDGFAAPNSPQVRISPGARQISTFCHVIDFSYSLPGAPSSRKPDKNYSQKYDVEFARGATYKVEPFWEGSFCRIRLIDSAGNELPMKNVLNPIGA